MCRFFGGDAVDAVAQRAVLVADPSSDQVTVAVDFDSEAGAIAFTMVGKPSPSNPRTGQDVPYSVLKSIKVRGFSNGIWARLGCCVCPIVLTP